MDQGEPIDESELREIAPPAVGVSVLPPLRATLKCTNQPLAALHNDELLLWGGPGKDDLRVIPQDIVYLVLTQIFQVCAVDHTCFGVPSHTQREQL